MRLCGSSRVRAVAGAAAQQADDDRSVSRQEFQSAMAVSTPAAHIAAACGRQ
jgi:hypothetical protein